MKKLFYVIVASILLINTQAQTTLDYYLPSDVSYNTSIPTPESIIGFQVGDWLVSHEKLVQYVKSIAESSNRATLVEYGRTYENRPLYHLIFTSPENHENLNQIKADRENIWNSKLSKKNKTDNQPLVVLLGYSVHGNESSAANSALLTAYYLAAAEGEGVDKMLENTIIIVDPVLNPDGLNRFATWGNMHKGQTISPDPNNRAFSEVWPGGRTNHYWFDLNRDYLLLTNPESRGRVQEMQLWKPNIVTDHHEMGSNSTFFFQPGIPSRNNPLTPVENYDLTKKIASYHAVALDKIGALYFSEENFDDYYFGKGSSYPDLNSGIGILFEQASVRGFKRETSNGLLTFPYAIRNQFTVTLSTLAASQALKKDLQDYQTTFYNAAYTEAKNSSVKAYVFGDMYDRGKTYEFLKILDGHNIKVNKLASDYNSGKQTFKKDLSYVVVLEQENYRLIRTLFEKVLNFRDSTFYDVSTWTLPLSFNMPYSGISEKKNVSNMVGEELNKIEFPLGTILGDANPYAWVIRWDEYYSPRALYSILKPGLKVKVATKAFTYSDDKLQEEFQPGTIMIPTDNQNLSGEEISELVKSLTIQDGIDAYGLKTGWNSKGIDLGSSGFAIIEKPEILMLVGNGTSSRDAGEIWHQFDTRYRIPIAMADVNRFSRINLAKYNTIILPGGSYGVLGSSGSKKLGEWVRNGGNLIAYKDANRWLSSNKMIDISFKKQATIDSTREINYANRRKISSEQIISGAIFEVQLDLTHPLSYGYHNTNLPVFKNSSSVANLPINLINSPLKYAPNPLISGYTSPENVKRIKNSPFLTIQSSGRGKVVSVFDNTNFRGVWYGTSKIFANSIFFGPLVSSGSSRY